MGNVFDFLSLIHIIIFFVVGVIVYFLTKKGYIGFSIGMSIAVVWEVLERIILFDYFGIVFFGQSYLNSVADLLVCDVIGLILAYFYVRQMTKR